jgi:hypothetical protein
MAGNDRKRQKRLEKKTARRKEKKKEVIRQESGGLPARLALAAKYPVLHCWMTNANFEQGMGMVVVSRALPDGNVAVANILIDRWCLGAKNGFATVLHRTEYDAKFQHDMRRKQPGRDVPVEDACKYVTGAIAYARDLGFAPHPDVANAMLLFAGVDPAKSTATYEFGKDGKPFYFAGPHEGPKRVRQILAILEDSCGPGGYHYTIPFSPDGGVMAIDDEDE